MKDFKLSAAALLSLCLLTGCYTAQGVGEDVVDVSHWMQNKPSTLGAYTAYAPRGYINRSATQQADEERREVAEAIDQATIQEPETKADTGGLVPPSAFADDGSFNARPTLSHTWEPLNHYDATNPSLPGGGDDTADAAPRRRGSRQNIVKYNPSVNVFPVDGDLAPYTQLESVNGSYGGYTGDGALAQEVFFAHGSAHIGKMDRKNLRELAGSLSNNGGYRVDIVGHASHRVNGVSDPVEKKMINFKMGQRRAGAVADEMSQAGLSPDWIQTSSIGDEEPNRRRNGKSQEAADRRAEVFVSNN